MPRSSYAGILALTAGTGTGQVVPCIDRGLIRERFFRRLYATSRVMHSQHLRHLGLSTTVCIINSAGQYGPLLGPGMVHNPGEGGHHFEAALGVAAISIYHY